MSISKEEHLLVKYNNDLNTLPLTGLNKMQMNFFFSIIALLNQKKSQSITISFIELKKIMKYKRTDNSEFIKLLQSTNAELLKLNFTLKNDDTIMQFAFFSTFKISLAKKKLEITINEDLQYLIKDLLNRFTLFELETYNSLRSTYSKNLFRLLKQWKSVGVAEFDYIQFRTLMDVPESFNNSKFNERVLNPAMKELSPYFENLVVTKQKFGRGGKLVGLKFSFNPESALFKKNKQYLN